MIAVVVKNLDPTSEEFESVELRREKVVPGGQEVSVYIGPLRLGRYEYVGNFNPGTARKTSLEGSPTFKVNYSNTPIESFY